VNAIQKSKHSEELLRRFAAALRGVQLYAPTHPLVSKGIAGFAEILSLIHNGAPSIAIGVLGDELVVGEVPIPRAAESMGRLIEQLKGAGVQRIVIDRGVQTEELLQLVQVLGGPDVKKEAVGSLKLPHVRVGRLEVEEQVADVTACRRMYNEAVSAAETVWESAQVEGKPDATAGRKIVDNLAQEVSPNRTVLLALTALKDYDSYTFTHMVNVSILTMGQARGLGIDGTQLRELGLSALMHDIGKVKTPSEILNKTEKLTSGEIEILRRHTIDGAEILKRTPEMPQLAPVVAFEHHLRLDGTGYPRGVARDGLNLATMLCGIADVYDAMRSHRVYQQAFPTDRILAVLKTNDGKQFDRNLVRRFAQLIGIYPVGNLVRLKSGEIAVVVKAYAADPYRPRVRILWDAAGVRVERMREVNLWEARDGDPQMIEAPVDPAQYDIDPLAYL
jgi:putative nucleotidyltransferase with HDIG domain